MNYLFKKKPCKKCIVQAACTRTCEEFRQWNKAKVDTEYNRMIRKYVLLQLLQLAKDISPAIIVVFVIIGIFILA